MTEYPYINTTGKLREFISKISSMGVPDTVTVKWLPTVGFGSTNHRRILKVLRFIGFLEGNMPTARWQSFRDSTKAQSIMAEAIREGYSELYHTYPDAHLRSDGDLKNFFKGHMPGGDQVIGNTVATFRSLCSFANFDAHAVLETDSVTGSKDGDHAASPSVKANVQNLPLVPLHIHLDIHISSDSTSMQIDQVFESMARHLYGREVLAGEADYIAREVDE
ncbi:MAG: DUF5343 domain-containing protein [Chloroflexi bacterium]|nr:DUF5343 domain-containing protein [Chloroflexota bacterium]